MKLLKNKTFRLLVWATVVSSFGDSLYALAITLSVYQLSGSLAGVAGMWLIRALIRIPCQFVSGVIVDRFNRKKVSIYVYLLSAALMLAFVFTNGKYMLFAYVLIFLLQGMSDVDNMAQMGLMSELIDKKDLTDANNLFSVAGTVIMLVGPGVGGVLYSVSGTQVLYAIDAVTFLAAAFFMWRLPYAYQKKEADKAEFTLFRFAKEGIAEVRKMPVVMIVMLTSVFFGILGRFYEIDKIYVADKILGIGAGGIVYFTYSMAIGSLLAPAVTKLLSKSKLDDVAKYALLSILLIGSFVLWGNTPVFVVSFAANVLIGLFNTGSSIFVNTIFQSRVDKSVFGRVMALRQIVVVLSAVAGIVTAPVLVEMVGVGYSMMGVGFLAVVFVVYLLAAARGKADAQQETLQNDPN